MSARVASQFKGADNSGWFSLRSDDVYDIERTWSTWAAILYDTEDEAIAASPVGMAVEHIESW